MASKGNRRRSFTRPPGKLSCRKLFIIAVEGAKTEPQYFKLINNLFSNQSIISVKCLKDKNASSPAQVLKRMQEELKKEELRNTDEAWLVVDKDQWTDEQLTKLHEWSEQAENYGFALSNPKFEYWLLLHFEKGTKAATSQKCSDRLKQHLPDYNKGIAANKITLQMIKDAIQRAKTRDNPPCTDWPRNTGSTVYKLVEHIMQSGDN